MKFIDELNSWNWKEVGEVIAKKTATDVQRVLASAQAAPGRRTIDDFMTLISPAAQPYLEYMAQLSRRLTLKRFGKTMQMYVPLYLSNECTNACTYCGFSVENKVARKTLSMPEIRAEAEVLRRWGFEHILLVTGEAPGVVDMDYFIEALEVVKPYFAQVSFEVQPLDEQEYKVLADHGLYAVLVYQETYNKANYKQYHTKGKKSVFEYRLDTPDRLGKAGIHKIGIGALLGLEDWRTDSFFTALHLQYLEKRYWQTRFSVSFPRLRPHAGEERENKSGVFMSDADLAQLICAWRIYNEDIEISLSTRESAQFRDHAMQFGVTSVSAASSTEPGGYATPRKELEQFAIHDNRSHMQVAQAIRQIGYEPVWKDWDEALNRAC
jgi:2-iminoacetate synthase